MGKTPLRCFAVFLLSAFYFLLSIVSEAAQEKYIYDSMNIRDPLIPLVDTKSQTGLRTNFAAPQEKVRLPLEVGVKGILWSGKEYYAIINDKVMRKGQKLGPIKIKDIETNKITLEYQGREFIVFFKKEEEK